MTSKTLVTEVLVMWGRSVGSLVLWEEGLCQGSRAARVCGTLGMEGT